MSKQFIEGNTYVFTKKKFITSSCKGGYKCGKGWVNKCNGREVDVNGQIYGFLISPAWCKCIKEGDKR